jgi:hypothetical protein
MAKNKHIITSYKNFEQNGINLFELINLNLSLYYLRSLFN